MAALAANEARPGIAATWQREYEFHLEGRLERSLGYLRAIPPAELRSHARSFFALLQETQRYPRLLSTTLQLIAALHPLPMHWGMTYAWEPVLRFALEHTPREETPQRAEYLCALGDVLLFTGRFDEAIEQSRIVLSIAGVPEVLVARAGRIAFLSLRFSGKRSEAEGILEQGRARFMADRPGAEVPAEMAMAWLVCNQSRLEWLREKGRPDEAYALVNDMIALDRRLGVSDPIRTADLLTQRSTLFWSRSRYAEAIADLNGCIKLYRGAGDILNAESRRCNLGLVHWLTGDLNQAEANLAAAMQLYQRIGLDQMLTYASGNLGLVSFCRGDLQEAAGYFEKQISIAQELNYLRESHRGAWNLALIHFYQGNPARLKDVYDSTLDYYSNRGVTDVFFLHVSWMALYHEKLGQHDQALTLAGKAVQVGREHDQPLLEQIALRCLASLLPAAEREAPLQRSLALATSAGRKYEEAAVWLGLAGAGEDAERRRQAWQTGSAMLREMGAEKWLEGRSMDNPPFLPPFL